jgi:EmrB/QacA subfamily drug resistance transporter
VTAVMSERRRWFALVVIGLAQLMVVLDATIVNVALPTVYSALGFASDSDLQWVVTAYTLTFGGFLLLGGRLADRYGRRLVFVAGLVVFSLASLVGGFAETPGLLIAARAVQGLGGALMSPAALSLLTVMFREGPERNRALGVWAAISGSGAAIGLLLGGILTDALSWEWVLFVNVPIGLLAIVLALRFIAESKDPVAGGFDVAGAASVTLGLVAVVFALVRANDAGWLSAQTVGLLVLAAVLLGLFLRLQVRGRYPLMPLRLSRNGNVAGADLAALLIGAGLFGMFFFLTLYLQQILGYSPLRTGLAFLPVSGSVILSATLAAPMIARVGPRPLLVGGMSAAGVGMLGLLRISPDTGYPTVIVPLVLLGLGMGCAFVSLTSAAVAGVPREDSGLASALLNSGQQVGGALGLAILTAVANARFDAVAPGGGAGLSPAELAGATTSSWVWGFGVSAGLLFLGAVVCGFMIKVGPEEVQEAGVAPVAA